jgi:hypothetical protein
MRDLAFIPGWEHEILAAPAFVCPGEPDVRYPAVPEVIDQPQYLGRNLEDEWPFARVDPHKVVDRVVVCRQLHCPRIDEVLPDDIRSVVRSEAAQRFPHTRLVHDRDGEEVGFQGA